MLRCNPGLIECIVVMVACDVSHLFLKPCDPFFEACAFATSIRANLFAVQLAFASFNVIFAIVVCFSDAAFFRVP